MASTDYENIKLPSVLMSIVTVRLFTSSPRSVVLAYNAFVEIISSEYESVPSKILDLLTHGESVIAMCPLPVSASSERSEGVFMLTSNSRWMLCHGTRTPDKEISLKLVLEGNLGFESKDRPQPFYNTKIPTARTCVADKCIVALSLWEGCLTFILFEQEVAASNSSFGSSHLLPPKILSLNISFDPKLDGKEVDLLASRSVIDVQATRADQLDALHAASHHRACEVLSLEFLTRAKAAAPAIDLAVLVRQNSLNVGLSGPCHVQTIRLTFTGTSFEYEPLFSLSNVHPCTRLASVGPGTLLKEDCSEVEDHAPVLLLCVNSKEVLLVGESGVAHRRSRLKPSDGKDPAVELLELPVHEGCGPRHFAAINEGGLIELIMVQASTVKGGSCPTTTSAVVEMASPGNDGGESTAPGMCAKTARLTKILSKTSWMIAASDVAGEYISLYSIELAPSWERFQLRLIRRLGRNSEPAAIGPIANLALLPPSFGHCLENVPLVPPHPGGELDVHGLQFAPKIAYCTSAESTDASKSSLCESTEGLPILASELSGCDIGIGPGFKMHSFPIGEGQGNAQALGNSQDLLVFVHGATFEVRAAVLSRGEGRIQVAASQGESAPGSALDVGERIVALQTVCLPEVGRQLLRKPKTGLPPLKTSRVLLQVTEKRLRLLSADASSVHSEWHLPTNESQIVAASCSMAPSELRSEGATAALVAAAVLTPSCDSDAAEPSTCEVYLFALSFTCALDVGSLNIVPITKYKSKKLVAQLSLFEMVPKSEPWIQQGPSIRRRALLAMSFWDDCAGPSILLAAADGVPLELAMSGGPSSSAACVIEPLVEHPLPLAVGLHPVEWTASGPRAVPQVRSLLFFEPRSKAEGASSNLKSSPSVGNSFCSPAAEAPLLVVGLSDGCVLFLRWRLNPALASPPPPLVREERGPLLSAKVLEVCDLRMGRTPVERLSLVRLASPPSLAVLVNSDVDALVFVSERSRVSSEQSSEPSSVELVAARLLQADECGASSAALLEVSRSSLGALGPGACSFGFPGLHKGAALPSHLCDFSLVWMDSRGHLSIGDLQTAGALRASPTQTPPLGPGSAKRPCLTTSLGNFCTRARVALDGRASHLLYLPRVNALLVCEERRGAFSAVRGATEEDGEGGEEGASFCLLRLFAAGDAHPGTLPEVWRKALAPGAVVTALALGPAPFAQGSHSESSRCYSPGALAEDGDDTGSLLAEVVADVVAVATLHPPKAPFSASGAGDTGGAGAQQQKQPGSLGSSSLVALLEVARVDPEGPPLVDTLGAARLPGSCFCLGPLTLDEDEAEGVAGEQPPAYTRRPAALAASADDKVYVLGWGAPGSSSFSGGGSSGGSGLPAVRLEEWASARTASGGCVTALATMRNLVAAAEFLGSLLVFRLDLHDGGDGDMDSGLGSAQREQREHEAARPPPPPPPRRVRRPTLRLVARHLDHAMVTTALALAPSPNPAGGDQAAGTLRFRLLAADTSTQTVSLLRPAFSASALVPGSSEQGEGSTAATATAAAAAAAAATAAGHLSIAVAPALFEVPPPHGSPAEAQSQSAEGVSDEPGQAGASSQPQGDVAELVVVSKWRTMDSTTAIRHASFGSKGNVAVVGGAGGGLAALYIGDL
mmetsp:Transcript_25186/g.56652  ORF Transcript_25186/g.56652 Transcript_25186/m.56652 type:complete len:1631 (-) Transcript_25186:425-5317(-)|eukprot:CAMPEP_0172609912 /NCGR_PEP_ID=MMETSP1068-20121228/29808_1 /TAXON_ID=35684 /ORGANISM="Pseudopedinella elastica, Strain CCMP716" /LENGTH=1630 /DNA_ID=CAMNT_0013413527 /DNA_START=41 /DNA_END=4933 /DNA_ORIENTATION=+